MPFEVTIDEYNFSENDVMRKKLGKSKTMINQIQDSNQLVRDYQRDGVIKIENFFSQEVVAEIRAELERYIREDLPSKPHDARTVEADGKTIRNLWRLERHDKYFQMLGKRQEIINLIVKFIGGDPVLVGVETFNKPARVGSGVPYHQDNAYFCQKPPDMLTLWVAIDRVTVENGAVYFIKGSHKPGMQATKLSGTSGNSVGLAEIPNEPKSEQYCATLNPGDATIHHCEIIHHSDTNQTYDSRPGLLFVYRGSHTQTDQQLKAAYNKAVTITPPAN